MATVIQFLMFTINIIFFLIGGVLLGFGIWLVLDPSAFDALQFARESGGMDDNFWAAAVYMIISIGAMLFIVGFLGCFGAWQASNKGPNCWLTLYMILVKLIIIAEIVCIILVAIFWNSLNSNVQERMTDDVRHKYVDENSTDGVSVLWNKIQPWLKCCGGANYMDYRLSQFTNYTNDWRDPYYPRVPWTCCVMKDGRNGKSLQDVKNVTLCMAEALVPYTEHWAYLYINANGCYYGLKTYISDNSTIFIVVLCIFAALQILGIVFACLIK